VPEHFSELTREKRPGHNYEKQKRAEQKAVDDERLLACDERVWSSREY
jgi:hypothetical protein